ncbi:Tetratricopeptide repeat 1 [Rhabdaerophilaceae bacterium]
MKTTFSAIFGFFFLISILVLPANAVSSDNSSLGNDPGYKKALELIKAERWNEALPVLLSLERDIRDSPDVYNLLGITYRKLKDYPTSKRHYDRALALDPGHQPTLEYQGEWFIETGDLPSAKANLALLAKLCGRCHEFRDLEAAIAKAEAAR